MDNIECITLVTGTVWVVGSPVLDSVLATFVCGVTGSVIISKTNKGQEIKLIIDRNSTFLS